MNNRKYILYADDDIDDREMMEHAFLMETEYTLVTFSNGDELLTFVKDDFNKDHTRLLVLDINMPVLNGMETLRRLKEDQDLKTIPAVMFSTSSNPKDAAEAKTLNTEVLSKPCSFNEVIEVSKKILDYCR